jgi:hypothetical protein
VSSGGSVYPYYVMTFMISFMKLVLALNYFNFLLITIINSTSSSVRRSVESSKFYVDTIGVASSSVIVSVK